jgi:hypothetical protein
MFLNVDMNKNRSDKLLSEWDNIREGKDGTD